MHDATELTTPARPAPPAGQDTDDLQLTAGLATAGALLGGIGFLYGAATATQRYGLLPLAWLAVYLALAAGFAVGVHLLKRSRTAPLAAPTRAARILDAVIDRLDWGGPEANLVLALAIPWLGFAGYGLIHLAQG